MSTTPTCVNIPAQGAGQKLPLVFLHGIGGRASGWGPIQQACAHAGHGSLAWDMPGYGDSPLIAPYDFDGLADALAALMDAQGLPQAVLVGHSLGGMVALQMWARHPQRVAGLVLAASSPAFGHGSGDFQQAFIAQRLAPLEAGRSMADVAEGLIPTMVAPGFDGPGLAQARACMGSITPPAYKAALGALVGLGRLLQGGHFLGDVVFAFWATYFSCVLVAWWLNLPPREASVEESQA